MSFARLIKFALFGHTAASIAAYELGRHKPRGYLETTNSTTEVKTTVKRMVGVELIPLSYLLLVKPEAGVLLAAYTLPLYTYQLGRYRANLEEERAQHSTPIKPRV
jgi:hypothetical protein